MMGQIFELGFSAIHQPTMHGAADAEVDALDQESSQGLLVVHATALYRHVP